MLPILRQVGPEALASGPTPRLSTCLSVCLDKALEGTHECAVSALRASVLLLVLLGDVFANDEFAGCASAELLQGKAAHQLLVRGRALGARAGQEAEEPADQRSHLRLEADDVQQVQETPRRPRDEAGQLRVAHLHDRLKTRDRRHRALVVVDEHGGLWGTTGQASGDRVGGEARGLDRPLRDAGDARESHHVAQYEDLGVARQGEVLVDGDAPRTVHLGARGLAQRAAQRARGDAGGPHLAHGFDPLRFARLVLDGDALGVHAGDEGVHLHLDAKLGEGLFGLEAEFLAEWGERMLRAVHQDDARLGRVDVAELALECVRGELADLSGHLDAGRAGAHDDEGQELVDQSRVGLDLGQLEGAENTRAQLEGVVDGLHARCEHREVVVAEVGLACARRDDQRVVFGLFVLVVVAPLDDARLDVDFFDEGLQDGHVLLAAQDLACGRGDVALGENARGHLVQQGLEEVVRCAGQDGDVGVGVFQSTSCRQACEAGTDDDNAVAGHKTLLQLSKANLT